MEKEIQTRGEHQKTLTDPFYQGEAKQLVDMMFDNSVFNPKMSRDDLQGVENLFAYYLDSNAKTARKVAETMLKIKKD